MRRWAIRTASARGVDYCEVLRYIRSPPTVVVNGPMVASSRLCPGRSYAVSALHFRVAYSAGDRITLLSNTDVSYMVIPLDIFESAQAAHECQRHSNDCNHGWSGSMSQSHTATQRKPEHGTFLSLYVGRCSGVYIAH